MIQRILFSGLALAFCWQADLLAHCQMPCGIYHDDMVFDQIDQYIETMTKGITVLSDNKFSTVAERNEFVRWVIEKEEASDEVAHILTNFFLQQKIKPNEEDTLKRVTSAHKLLFYLVAIKQTVDLKTLNDFYEEWERFKLMFHIEGYSCKLEQIKLKKWAQKQKELLQDPQNQPNAGSTNQHNHSHDHDHDHDHDHPHDHTH